MASNSLTQDKVAPLLKKPEAVVLLVDLYSVIAVKVIKGKIDHLSVIRGLDQKANATSALNYLKASGGKLPKNLIIASHEVALTSVPVSFGNDVSFADANQALVWQLNEIISDVFPTPTTRQVAESTHLLSDEKYETWKQYSANSTDIPNADQALTTLGLLEEDELDTLHRDLEFITPQSLEQLHLGWRPMVSEETAVFAIKKELRQNWLTYAKENKLKLVAILPLSIPSSEFLEGKKGHFTRISPAKVSTYYFEKGQLSEVREFPRKGPFLPESWLLNLDDPDEVTQTIYCSKRDHALVENSTASLSNRDQLTIAAGDRNDELTLENIIAFSIISPEKRSLPYISPLEPLPPVKYRRLPYYATAASLAALVAGGIIYPKITADEKLDAEVKSLTLNRNRVNADLNILRNRQSEIKQLDVELNKLRSLHNRAKNNASGDEQIIRGDFWNADHHLDLLRSLAVSMSKTQVTLDTFSSNEEGHTNITGLGPSVPEIQKFGVPFLESHSKLNMPAHTMTMKQTTDLFEYHFSIAPQ